VRKSSYKDIPVCIYLKNELDKRKPSIDSDKTNSVLANIRSDFLSENPKIEVNRVFIGNRANLADVLESLLPNSANDYEYHRHGALDVLLLSSEEYRVDSFFEYPIDKVVSHSFVPVTIERCEKHLSSDEKPVQRLCVSFSKSCDGALDLGMKQSDSNENEFSEQSDFRQVDSKRNYQVLSLIKENAPLVNSITISLDFESNKIPITNPLMNVNRLTVYRSILDLKQVTAMLVGEGARPAKAYDYIILDSEDDNTQYIFLAMMEKCFSYLTEHLQIERDLAVTLIKDKFRLFEQTELAERLYMDSDKSFAKLPAPGRLKYYDTLGNSDSVMIRLLALFRVVSSKRITCLERSKFLIEKLCRIHPEVEAIAKAGLDTDELWSRWTTEAIEVIFSALTNFNKVKLALTVLKKRQDKIVKLEEYLKSSSYIQSQKYLEDSHPRLDWRKYLSELKAMKKTLLIYREHEFDQKVEELLDKISNTLDYTKLRTELDNSETKDQIKKINRDVNGMINDCIQYYSNNGEETDLLDSICLILSKHMMDLLAYTGKCD